MIFLYLMGLSNSALQSGFQHLPISLGFYYQLQWERKSESDHLKYTGPVTDALTLLQVGG